MESVEDKAKRLGVPVIDGKEPIIGICGTCGKEIRKGDAPCQKQDCPVGRKMQLNS